ncbi:MAG: UDP-N-acetylmuramoyl-L-alanyl-D-glutamate--2,6-diaminopimelate ligase [Candidatus Omnitrophica bacterium]|nr:UDP-N-acetylmuramoyl-L-alanyl-D-glutamate--2,6-diaminopimelate ligase [Candidatus Omnitrophota bacterium]
MKLSKVLAGIDFNSKNFQDIEVRGLAVNSNKIQRDYAFIALTGEEKDGHDFIYQAIERGSSIIVAQKGKFSDVAFSGKVILVEVADTKEVLKVMASNFYGSPEKSLSLIGVTGTNGKTTITFLLEAIFQQADFFTGLIGTICYKIANREIPAFNTTPDGLTIRKYMKEMVDQSTDVVVMEASSHGLAQGRLSGLRFDAAVFTNLDRDHLDYHKDMDSYYRTKKTLFTDLLKEDGFAVINTDDSYGRDLYEQIKSDKISYGFNEDADISVEYCDIGLKGMHIKIKVFEECYELCTSIIGKHNVYNIMASIAVAKKCGIEKEIIIKALESFAGVRGRLERVYGSSEVRVFIDYAHTPKALEEILSLLKSLKQNKLWVVFGCGGDRYSQKRPQMGRIASNLADVVIITSDNPRSENPMDIIEGIRSGIDNSGAQCYIIPDRKEAIEKAIYQADCRDLVLIAGKGHENYQIVNNLVIPFDDREIAKRSLAKRTMEKMANVS